MADSALPPPASGPETSHGLPSAVSGLLGSLGHHVQTLLALAGHESKEAATHYLWLAVILGLGLILAVFGYVFLVLFVAFLLALIFGISWLWICLGLTVLHLVGAGVCGLLVKARFATPVFTSTSIELKKDFDSLKDFRP